MSKLEMNNNVYMKLAQNPVEGWESAQTGGMVVEVKDVSYERKGLHYSTRLVVYDYNRGKFFEMNFIEGDDKVITAMDKRSSRDESVFTLEEVKMRSVTTIEFVKEEK